ncbi:MAG: hypothetical protein H3C64_10275 [Candidatus Kuenenia stuttgartiensis]|nr:hypothetical protein [Candidatus Kuenenia stuttgartiensis]
MGRYRTGVLTTGECKRIEIGKLIKSGYLKKGCLGFSQYYWSDGSSITLTGDMMGSNSHIQLQYSVTSNDGTKKAYDYKIEVVGVPSNLGKGEVLYFRCPVSRKLCRILYKAYGCPIWKSREAYNNRIYYSGQLSSKKDRYNDRYWALDKQLEAERKKRKTYTYKGVTTRRASRVQYLIDQQIRMDNLRWSIAAMPVALQKIFRKNGVIM